MQQHLLAQRAQGPAQGHTRPHGVAVGIGVRRNQDTVMLFQRRKHFFRHNAD